MAVFNRVYCSSCNAGYNVCKKDERKRYIVCKKCSQVIPINAANKNFYIEYYVNNRRIREKVGHSRELAENALRKRKIEIAENKFLDIKKEQKIKFNDFAEDFLNIHSKTNKKSWKSDEHNLKSLNKYFGNCYLYTITSNDIERFVAERRRQVAPATVNRELATFKTMFNKALVWGKIEVSPAKAVKFLKEPTGRLRFLDKEEIVRLFSNCPEKLKPIVILAIFTGMRRGEILGIKWQDIDFNNNIITLLDTKNGEKREIYMNERVREAIISICKHAESQFVFCDEKGKPYRDIRKSFFTALKKSGINSFHFHDLRHTFGSQLVMSGFDINTVRELLGHKDIRMTLRYAHLSQSYKKRALDVLGSSIDTISTLEAKQETSNNVDFSQLIEDKELTLSGA